MTSTIIIPARLASTRFASKLTQDLCGKSVLEHTWHAAISAKPTQVVIATCDAKLVDHAHSFGATAVLTSTKPRSGSDRVCEAAVTMGLEDDSIVVNLQGDEPLFHPQDIALLLAHMEQHPEQAIVSMMHPLDDEAQSQQPSCVKVVVDASQRALYFSRANIPYPRANTGYIPMMHQGIYGFRLHALKQFVALPDCALETTESLEQLRALYHAMDIHMIQSHHPAHPGVDTPADLDYARRILSTTPNP